MAKIYAFAADGMEEVECLAVCDVLVRAGMDVRLVSIMGRKQVTGSHGFRIETDALFEEIQDDADVLFLPGGLKGTENLKKHEGLARMLKEHAAAGKRHEKGALRPIKVQSQPGHAHRPPSQEVYIDFTVSRAKTQPVLPPARIFRDLYNFARPRDSDYAEFNRARRPLR